MCSLFARFVHLSYRVHSAFARNKHSYVPHTSHTRTRSPMLAMNDIFGSVWEHSENNYGKCVGRIAYKCAVCLRLRALCLLQPERQRIKFRLFTVVKPVYIYARGVYNRQHLQHVRPIKYAIACLLWFGRACARAGVSAFECVVPPRSLGRRSERNTCRLSAGCAASGTMTKRTHEYDEHET